MERFMFADPGWKRLDQLMLYIDYNKVIFHFKNCDQVLSRPACYSISFIYKLFFLIQKTKLQCINSVTVSQCL